MIVHQRQPSPKSCGQTCLAMLLGVPAAQVIADLPDTRATTAGELAVYLLMRGWGVTKLIRYRGTLPDLAILRVVWPGPAWRTGHWILYCRTGKYVAYLDPASDGGPTFWRARGGRIASFIALSPPSERAG